MTHTKPHVGKLKKFGQFIGNNFLKHAFVDSEIKHKAGKADSLINHFDWALKQLPKVDLSNWRYHQDGTPYLLSHPGLNSLTASAVYFNLDADQLFHLFVPGYQDSNFGEILDENTDPSELALNINRFTDYFIPDEDDNICQILPLKKEKKVKKFKLKNVA